MSKLGFVALPCALLTTLAAAPAATTPQAVATPQSNARPWLQSFNVRPTDLATVGENRYFILMPGYALTLEGREGGKAVRLVVTVLNETKTIGGVDTRVVEERESQAGALAEVSRNYFAIERGTGNVYYFGEDVDAYKDGKVVNHDGSWLHRTAGATFGMAMPGSPAVGLRFYQELAPGVAMDRAEVVSLSERLVTPAGAFEKCLKTVETTPLEPAAREVKLYAPAVGLVQDGTLQLTAVHKQ